MASSMALALGAGEAFRNAHHLYRGVKNAVSLGGHAIALGGSLAASVARHAPHIRKSANQLFHSRGHKSPLHRLKAIHHGFRAGRKMYHELVGHLNKPAHNHLSAFKSVYEKTK